MRKFLVLVAALSAVIAGLSGCVHSQQSSVYSREDVGRPQSVRMGSVVALRPIKIEGTKSPIGTGAGAVVGGIAGSGVGGGKGSYVAAVLGAVAGGLLGSAAEEGMTRTDGVEITVKEDSGQTYAYVQALTEGEVFRVGDRVRIMSINGTSRVSH